MSWTQAICVTCWLKENSNRKPAKVTEGVLCSEKCCMCGETTKAGIYVRKDPNTVPYPTGEEG